ncbi:signal peptidase I [Glutamicibacter mysorens]
MTVLTRAQRRREEQKTGPFWWVGQIFSWLALFIVLTLLVVMVVIPKLGGATAYTVLTGSMRPDYPPGQLIVVKPVPVEQIEVGDVLTYQLESGKPEVVTHRVAAVHSTLSGEKQFVVRGDANNTDDAPIVAEQVRGKLWYSLPWLGYLNSALSSSQRTWLTWLAIGGLLSYSLVMFAGAWRDHRRESAS